MNKTKNSNVAISFIFSSDYFQTGITVLDLFKWLVQLLKDYNQIIREFENWNMTVYLNY